VSFGRAFSLALRSLARQISIAHRSIAPLRRTRVLPGNQGGLSLVHDANLYRANVVNVWILRLDVIVAALLEVTLNFLVVFTSDMDLWDDVGAADDLAKWDKRGTATAGFVQKSIVARVNEDLN